MIQTTEPLVDAMASMGYAVSSHTRIVTPKTEITALDFCLQAYESDYVELAFSSNDGDIFKNDKSSFLVNMIDLAGSFSFYLTDGTTDTPLIDDTYGTYYGFGSLAQANKIGYIVDWKKVADTLGYGRYIFKVNISEFGTAYNQESHIFHAMPYSDEIANGTVRLKTTNTGNTQNGVDYSGMEWPRSARLFVETTPHLPTIESTSVLDSERRSIPIQEVSQERYSFSTSGISKSIYDLIRQDLSLNIVTVDTYGLFDFAKLKNHSCVFDEFSELEANFMQSTKAVLKFSLMDYEPKIKRFI